MKSETQIRIYTSNSMIYKALKVMLMIVRNLKLGIFRDKTY